MSVTQLTTEDFKKNIFDFTAHKEWKYEGERPAIIDFYADWCGPCKMVAPILKELSEEYEGKVDFYKVDTEVEQELSYVFGIRSIPSLLFIPTGDKPPMMQAGALPKDVLVKVINTELLVEAKEEATEEK